MKIILFFLFFVSLASAQHCPLYLAGTIKRLQSKKLKSSYEELAKLAENAEESDVLEWYLLNTQLSDSFLLNSNPRGPDKVTSKMSRAKLRALKKYYDQSVFNQSEVVFSKLNEFLKDVYSTQISSKAISKKTLGLEEIGREIKSGESVSLLELINDQRQTLRRIQREDDAIERANSYIYHMKSAGLIKEPKVLAVIHHHFLSDLELFPGMHGLPSFDNSFEVFNRQLTEKIFWGEFLFADIHSRLKTGIDALDSSAPYIPYAMPVQRIKDSKNQWVDVDINYYELGEFCRENPKRTFQQNLEAYLEKFHKWSVSFNSGKNQDFTEMKAITDDFKKLYFDVTAQKPQVYKNKMSIFYQRSNVFRGQSYTKRFSDDDALDFFVDFKPEFLSMRASRGRGIIVKHFVKKDFQLYNRLIKKGDARVLEYIKDHMTMGDDYFNSPFASTSKVEHVARRFSKGFLRDLNHIKQQKSQVIAEYRWRKGYGTVDVNRLRSLTSEWGKDKTVSFGSKYARQQEVMVAGGLAPDELVSLKIVDVTDVEPVQNTGEWIAKAKEERVRTFTRDQNDPRIIHVTEEAGKSTETRSYEMVENFWGNLKFKRLK